MIGTLLYVFGSCEHNSELRDIHSFQTDTRRRLFVVDVSIDWSSNRNWHSKVLNTWCQKSDYIHTYIYIYIYIYAVDDADPDALTHIL